MEKKEIKSRLLLRVAADLKKELNKTTIEMYKRDLEEQIEGLEALHKEIEDFRTIKRILKCR